VKAVMDVNRVWEARARITPYVNKTPLIRSPVLSEQTKANVFLKLENVQPTGSFKVRGAANKILSLSQAEQSRCVTTFSTGNHALAVSSIARHLDMKAVICVSHRVPKAKLDAIRRYGVEIRNDFDSQDDAEAFCSQLEREGLTVIKPFDDPSVIAGQGTIGLELMEDLPHVETVVIPLSGGGLLSGIGLALKANNPRIRVVGVSVERGAVMYESIKAGKPVILEEKETLADSLLGGIGLDNRFTLSMVQQLADEILLVSEPSIAAGMAYMLEAHRMGVEGAAAVGLAAVMEQKLKVDPGENIAVIVSGNNVDLSTLLRVTQQYSSSTNHLT